MKNKFWAGFLSGLAGAILLIAIGFAVINILPISNDNFDKGKELSTSDKADSDKVDDIVKKLEKLDKVIDKNYMEEVDEEALVEGIYKGYVAGLGDPYSNYFTRQEYKDLMESSSGVYFGIGASVSQDITTGIIKIVKPFVSSPAYEEGLLPEDILYKVDGEEVTGKDLTEVVSKIKGPEGTTTDLTIIREGENDELEFVVPRRKIEIPTIEHVLLDNQIGYISILEFDQVTVQQFKDAIEELDSQGQRGLIIDVRDNPGGLLDAVSEMLTAYYQKV